MDGVRNQDSYGKRKLLNLLQKFWQPQSANLRTDKMDKIWPKNCMWCYMPLSSQTHHQPLCFLFFSSCSMNTVWGDEWKVLCNYHLQGFAHERCVSVHNMMILSSTCVMSAPGSIFYWDLCKLLIKYISHSISAQNWPSSDLNSRDAEFSSHTGSVPPHCEIIPITAITTSVILSQS